MRQLWPLLLTIAWSPVGYARAWFDADHSSLPCRPTIACTADIVEPGSVEVEIGYLFRQLTPDVLQHSMPILGKLTLARFVQLQVGGNGATFQNTPPPRYLDNIVTGFKFHLHDQKKRAPSLSWSVALSSPLSSNAAYLRAFNLFYIAYVTKDFAWLHADLNLGLNLWRLDGPTKAQPWAALALSVALPKRLSVMLENYCFFVDASPAATRDGGTLAALAYAPRAWIVFDVGGDAGWFHSTRLYSAFVGMTISPVVMWRR
jgi:hypothetical protein